MAGNAIQPDPRAAILAFKRDLNARGISLIVVPGSIVPALAPAVAAFARSTWASLAPRTDLASRSISLASSTSRGEPCPAGWTWRCVSV